MLLRTCVNSFITVSLVCVGSWLSRVARADDDIDLSLGGSSRFLPPLVLASDEEPPTAQHPDQQSSTGLLPDINRVMDGEIRVAQAGERPIQPPERPTTPTQQEQTAAPSLSELLVAALSPGAQTVSPTAGPAAAAASTDVGQFLASAQGAETVSVQHRSEVAFDPVIRGYYGGQIYAVGDGAYWYAARPDLDTMLSKFEPALIQNITVIPGPYGVQYGPGFSFIDLQSLPTIRSQSGCFESDYTTLALFKFNGSAGSVREIIDGGGSDWGARLSYGFSKGSDYKAGNGMSIPSAYDNRDALAQFSYDLGLNTHLDVAYQRFDQQETEYPGRLFDIDHLGTDAFIIHLYNDDAGVDLTKWTANGWYNRTDFRGHITHNLNYPQNISDPKQFWTVERIEAAVDVQNGDPIGTTRLDGTTAGNDLSTGVRLGTQFGDSDDVHMVVGGDFRYLQQNIVENYVGTVTDLAFQADALGPFADNMSTSYMWNPGSYVQWSMPWTCYFKTDVGFRYDFVQTNARLGELGPEFVTNSNLTPPFNEGDSLYAAYITNELKLDKGLTVRVGLGHAEAPPTLLERYSNGVFVGIGQDGFTKLIGDPNLEPALDTQVDAALEADYDCWRGKAGAYYAWINDYITYTDDLVFGPTFPSARTFRFANTRLATLTGFELAGEYDLTCSLSPFGRMAYVYGVDEELHASLPDIPPLDTVFGIRWHDPCKDRKWQIELFGRADYRQTHVGYIPSASTPGLIPVGEPTPGFLVWNIHAYYYYSKNLKFIAGIDNIFDRTYIQALDLRLTGPFTAPPSSGGTAIFPTSFVYEPGFSPYLGLEWKY